MGLHYFDRLINEGHFVSGIVLSTPPPPPKKKTKKPVTVYPDLGDGVMGVVGG